MAASIQISGLRKAFDGVVAVDDVTLDIEPGELFFLLGPSGCGKTTLLRCIAGFCVPDRGTVRLGGRDITSLPPYQRNTGMVFQSYALWPHLSVRDNVSFGLELRRLPAAERRRLTDEVLELVKMTDRAGRRPNELSGGQQQRVALARALVIRPACLLLDEPLSNLDAKLRLEMRTEIRRICKQSGLTAVYVTHDQTEALSIADRLAIIDKGRIEQCGRPQDVYRRPNSRFTAGFIGETNFIGGTAAGRSGAGLEVDTELGRVIGAAPAEGCPAAGAEVTISVRPEAIRIGAGPGANAFEGELHDTAYLGEVAQHQVDVSSAKGGTVTLKVCELQPRIVARDHAKEKVRVWFDPADAVILTR